MTRKKLALPLLLALVTCAAAGSVRHDDDVFVAVGAGAAGTWETEFEFANPDDAIAVNVFASEQPFPYVCVRAPCGIAYAPLPRTGTARIVTHAADFGTFTGRLFVGADDAEELPTVKARVINRARPSQSIELPLYRRSTLVNLNPRVLSFPGAQRSAGAHTNLFISEIGLSREMAVLVEVFSPSGERLGQEVHVIPRGQTLFLQDVLSRLGVNELAEGQIRVTRTAGNGILWGLLTTMFDDGRVSVAAGKHL
ncbi:MAG TPA: hypothetical protein VLG15_02600 [Thermoanaerobaculia bacterium]|nr:hypothetical protein [Thermoanaerobaculia bacterium]